MKKVLIVLLIISLSLSLLMIAIEKNSYNIEYYSDSFEKYGIEEITGKDMGELLAISTKLIEYLKNKGGEELLQPQFNEREILHMDDVQVLFNYARIVKFIGLLLSIIILFYCLKNREYRLTGLTLTFGLFINHILLLILGLLSMSNFNKYFTYFHEIFFNNDLWLLDPTTDLMIQMLPEEFFMGMAKNIGLSFLIYLAILQIVGCYYILKGRRRDGNIFSKNKR